MPEQKNNKNAASASNQQGTAAATSLSSQSSGGDESTLSLSWETGIKVSVEVNRGELVGLSAVDAKGTKYNVSLHLEPQKRKKHEFEDCYVCVMVGGRLICRFVQCRE